MSLSFYQVGRETATRPKASEAFALGMLARVNTQEILAALDIEIARLQHARTLIAGSGELKRRGQPPGATKAASGKRGMSDEGRMRVAEAQRKRWAAKKKQKALSTKG